MNGFAAWLGATALEKKVRHNTLRHDRTSVRLCPSAVASH